MRLTEEIECGLWPTPTTKDNAQIKGGGARGTTLGAMVRLHPVKDPSIPIKHDGAMNPEFVEYLMGFPIGWTELKP